MTRIPAFELELRQLRAFVALADRGSVTAASRTLGLAQSTVSEALAALERSLGTPMFQRHSGTRSGRMTAAGRALLPRARDVLAAVEQAHIAVVDSTNKARAAVDIIANESVSTYLLPGVLREVRRQWPNTRFSVSVAMCAGVRGGVNDGAFDLGLLLDASNPLTSIEEVAGRTAPSAERQVVAAQVSLVVFTAPSHPLLERGAGASLRRSALAGFPLFVSDAAGDFHTLVNRFFEGDGMPGPRLQATGSVEGVKKGVLADPDALGILPSYAVAEELRTGTVVRLELRPAPPKMRLEAVLSESRARHPSTAALLEGMRRAFASDVGAASLRPRKSSVR
jgi:DNA-binding transcriptional LysR family regulator